MNIDEKNTARKAVKSDVMAKNILEFLENMKADEFTALTAILAAIIRYGKKIGKTREEMKRLFYMCAQNFDEAALFEAAPHIKRPDMRKFYIENQRQKVKSYDVYEPTHLSVSDISDQPRESDGN